MTLANDLEGAWQTLEAGDTRPGLMRSLADFGIKGSRMMLAIEDGCREILFPAAADFSLESLQRTRGVKVVLRGYGTDSSAARFLVLRCTNPEFHAVFRRFGGAVIDHVATSSEPARAALDVIRAWQEMFNRAGAKNESTLLGIFGELHELLGLVARNRNALLAWTGPDARPQDFISGKRALEVKTTRALAADVEIHGIEQLWAKPYEQLVLVVKQVVIEPAGDRIADLVAKLIQAGVAGDGLYARLEAFDLDAQQIASLNEPRFTHRNTRYFLVTNDAAALTPDLLSNPLPAGISRLQYRIALNSPGFQAMSPENVDAFLARLSG